MWFFERHERDRAWRRAMRLVREVYRFTERLPADEKSNLTASMRRTVLGLPPQIVEGIVADDPRTLADKLDQCRQGVRELQTLVALAGALGYGGWRQRMVMRRRLRGAAGMLFRRAARLRAMRMDDPEEAAAADAEAAPPSEGRPARGAVDQAWQRGAVRRLQFRHLADAA